MDSGVRLDSETPSGKKIMDDSNIQETAFCDKECPVEPPSKRRKIQSRGKCREIQSKTAKTLELVLGKTPEVPEIDRLKQTVSKNPKAHFYRKKYASVLSKVQTQVLRELKLVKEKLTKWDETFLTEHGRLPNNNDYVSDSEFKELSKKKKTALKLLESSNITVHVC